MQVGEVPPRNLKPHFSRYNRAFPYFTLAPLVPRSYRSRLGSWLPPRFPSSPKWKSRAFFVDLTFPRPTPSVCLRFFFNSIAPIISPPKFSLQQKFSTSFSSVNFFSAVSYTVRQKISLYFARILSAGGGRTLGTSSPQNQPYIARRALYTSSWLFCIFHYTAVKYFYIFTDTVWPHAHLY